MLKTIQCDGLIVTYKLLGRKTGGFHPRYGDVDVVSQRLAKLTHSFGNDSATVMIAQGGSEAIVVDPGTKEAEADALITTHAGHNLILRPADCLPVILISSQPMILALIHASRRGLEQGVIENALSKMMSFGLSPSECIAHIGPGISSKTYILPRDTRKQLQHNSWTNNIREIDKASITVDLAGFTDRELQRLGIPKNQITKSSIDTARGDEYFSHYRATRKGDINGRNGFVCAIKKI